MGTPGGRGVCGGAGLLGAGSGVRAGSARRSLPLVLPLSRLFWVLPLTIRLGVLLQAPLKPLRGCAVGVWGGSPCGVVFAFHRPRW